jgi:N-acetylmuramoyl-L-alanine amidase CwlA
MIPITPMLITNKRKRPNRKLKEIKAIIIHWTANKNKGANAIANRNYFQNDHKDSKGKLIPPASAHFNVDDLRIIQCVPEDEVAFHVGAKWVNFKTDAHRLMGTNPTVNKNPIDTPNNYTIGIEMCVNIDSDWQKVLQNTIDLTRYLMNKYNIQIENILRHYDITGKDCPKMMCPPFEQEWVKFKKEIVNISSLLMGNEIVKKVDVDSTLNIRFSPLKNAEIVGSLNDGDTVKIISEENGWSKLAENNWVYSKYLTTI